MSSISEKQNETSLKWIQFPYLENGDLLQLKTKVTEIGSTKFNNELTLYWIKTEKTIFQPQSSGRLSDKGTINSVPVSYVHKKNKLNVSGDFDVLHCFEKNPDFEVGESVVLNVDEKFRKENSTWHTAADIIHYIISSHFPNLCRNEVQSYPFDAFVNYRSNTGFYPDEKEIIKVFNQKFEELLKDDVKIDLVKEESVRKIVILDKKQECWGTHVPSLKDLGQVVLKQVINEGYKLRINFHVGDQ
jgi:Ser-tRNA(Ala) deacylase AlaX